MPNWLNCQLLFNSRTHVSTPTVYLSLADALAIRSGTWTIDPGQSLNLFLGGQLPLEEFIFFLLTNILLIFGMVLALACDSQKRMPVQLLAWLDSKQKKKFDEL